MAAAACAALPVGPCAEVCPDAGADTRATNSTDKSQSRLMISSFYRLPDDFSDEIVPADGTDAVPNWATVSAAPGGDSFAQLYQIQLRTEGRTPRRRPHPTHAQPGTDVTHPEHVTTLHRRTQIV
jgi:hypothetical protein